MAAVTRVLVLALILGALFYFRHEAKIFAIQSTHMLSPCTIPVSYSIDYLDPRFGLATSGAAAHIEKAVRVWEDAAERDLFVTTATRGVLSIRFIYDKRQATTEKLNNLGEDLSSDLASYENQKDRYESLQTAYESARIRFDTLHAKYELGATAYQEEVRRWNARGGAPPSVYDELEQDKKDLENMEAQLGALQSEVNSYVGEINALVPTLNRLAHELNLTVATYNKVGEGQGEEFEEAVFESRPGSMSIKVYEYDSVARLVRVLEHEFGHAIGLEHIEDPDAIMYRLNQGSNETLTEADKSELTRHCRL